MSHARAPIWNPQAPRVPVELDGVSSLGHRTHVHATKPGPFAASKIWMAIGAVLCAGAIVIIVFASDPFLAIPAVMAGLIIGVGGLTNYVPLATAARVVVTYHDGFAALTGSTPTVVKWEDVTGIVSKERVFSSGKRRSVTREHRYDVANRSGKTVVFHGERVEDVKRLIEVVKRESYARRLPALQKRWDAGETLTFGAVRASREEIEAHGRRIRWKDVRDAAVKDGRLILTPADGRPLKVRVSKIPDVEMLGALMGIEPAKMDLVYI